MTENKNYLKRYSLWISVLPAIAFFTLFFYYAVNIPHSDDWDVLYMFCIWDDLTFIDKVKVIFTQHNEHRIAITRLFALLQYHLSGQVDVRSWMLLGNLGYLLIFFVLYRFLRRERLEELLPTLSLFLFTPFAFGNIFSGMQNGNTLFVALSICLLYVIVYQRSIIIPIVLLALIMFSNGGGFLPFAIGLCVLLFQKRYHHSIWFSLAGLLLISLYFWGYKSVLYHPDPILTLKNHPEVIFSFFFCFLGDVLVVPHISILAGWLLFTLLLYYLPKAEKHIFLFSLFAFIIFTAVSVSLNRGGFGFEMALANRYRIYSQLFFMTMVILVYQVSPDYFKLPFYRSAMLIFLLLFVYKTFVKKSIYEQKKEAIVSNFFNWKATGHYLTDRTITQLASELMEKKYYILPGEESDWIGTKEKEEYSFTNSKKIPFRDLQVSVNELDTKNNNLQVHLTPNLQGILSEGSLLLVLVPYQKALPKTYYLSNGSSYIFDMRILNPSINANSCEIRCEVPLKKVPHGRYDVYLEIRSPLILDNDYIRLLPEGIRL